jgi:hypothetical protein
MGLYVIKQEVFYKSNPHDKNQAPADHHSVALMHH